MAIKDRVDENHLSIEDFLRQKAELDQTIRKRFQREVTMMFTDIVASSRFFEVHGDLEGRSMIQWHNDLLIPILGRHGGRVLKRLGDGLMVLFEDPPAAARAAVEIQKTIAEENRRKKPTDQIWLKVAVHYGLGLVEESDAYGDVVNTSAHICSLARKGDILVSQPYIEAVREEPGISHEYVGMKILKGKTVPIDIYRILWDPVQEADLRRSIEKEAYRTLSDEDALWLHFVLDGERICLTAFVDGEEAQAIRFAHEYPYRETELRNLVEQINHCRAAVDQRGRVAKDNLVRLKDLCRTLHEMLIPQELGAFMAESPVRTLILRLDERLVFIPWELLYGEDGFLCLRYAVGRVVSSFQQVEVRTRDLNRGQLRMLVVADPRGDLAATKTEGIAIQKELGKGAGERGISVSLRGRDATCDFLDSHLSDYDLFHFAGHSDYDLHDPSLSGLLLADGKFEIGRLLSLARDRVLPSLVFMNACQSGRAEEWSTGDRLFGLANAFLYGGVRHYIGSTMDLFDRSSAAFAEEFYMQLAQNRPIGEALRQARLKSVSRYGEETLTWASYVLYGDPGFKYLPQAMSIAEDMRRFQTRPIEKAIAIGVATVLLVVGSLFMGNFWIEKSRRTGTAKQGFSLIHAGKVALAEEVFQSLEGKTPLYYQGMSAVHLSRGEIQKAEETLRMAQKGGSSDPYGMVMTAHLALGKGSLEEAEVAYRNALRGKSLEPWQKAECHFGLGRILLSRGAIQEALVEYDRAIGLDPSFMQAYTAKGVALERLGKLQGAVKNYSRAAVINADDRMNAVLYERSRERLEDRQTADRRTRIDALMADILKTYEEGRRSVDSQDEWSSRPLGIFFVNLEAKGQSAPREGEDDFFSELILREVSGSQRLTVVERALLDRVLEELKIGTSDLADSKTSLRVGKILSARILATGTILRFNDQIQITLRAVDTETTQVTAAVTETCAVTEDPLNMLQALAQGFRNRLLEAYPVRGRITEVRDGQVVLNVGSALGVTPGMKLRVQEEEGKGIELAVREVLDESSIAVPADGHEMLQTGWRVEAI